MGWTDPNDPPYVRRGTVKHAPIEVGACFGFYLFSVAEAREFAAAILEACVAEEGGAAYEVILADGTVVQTDRVDQARDGSLCVWTLEGSVFLAAGAWMAYREKA